MAKRGDVLVAKRKLGFAAEGVPQHFVVLQSDQLRDLDTVLVAPLDDDGALYEGDPLVVRVTAKEAGTSGPQVVLVHLLTSAMIERFEAKIAGKLSAASMAEVERMTALALDL